MESKYIGNNQYSGLSVEDRFWQKVDKKSDDECWEWLGSTHHQWGYGNFAINKKYVAAHRYSWEQYHNQKIPEGMFICHHCDNPSCVNPNHLFLGTPKDNVHDKMKKGRHPNSIGSLNNRAILTEQQVIFIKYLCRNKIISRRDVAKMCGVASVTIDAIMVGRNWSHVL